MPRMWRSEDNFWDLILYFPIWILKLNLNCKAWQQVCLSAEASRHSFFPAFRQDLAMQLM